MKNILTLGILILLFDVAVLGIMKVIGYIDQEKFMSLLNDSLWIVGILVAAGLVIKIIARK
ncbi:MAG: hypothetical protein ACI9GH_000334 [Candidatus Paceibacteria bacterium]|jgi:hypothetical protein